MAVVDVAADVFVIQRSFLYENLRKYWNFKLSSFIKPSQRFTLCIVKTTLQITLLVKLVRESKAVTLHVFQNSFLRNIAEIFLLGKEYINKVICPYVVCEW